MILYISTLLYSLIAVGAIINRPPTFHRTLVHSPVVGVLTATPSHIFLRTSSFVILSAAKNLPAPLYIPAAKRPQASWLEDGKEEKEET